MDSTYPMPLNRRVKKLIDGLTYQAVKSGSNWMLPLGKDAAAGEYITVDGVLGHATAAIVGGTDTIVEDTNWVPEGDGGALNALNSNCARFLNVNRILVDHHDYGMIINYTATEDCYFIGYAVNADGTTIKINNVTVFYTTFAGSGMSVYLKKGQTITSTGSSVRYIIIALQ